MMKRLLPIPVFPALILASTTIFSCFPAGELTAQAAEKTSERAEEKVGAPASDGLSFVDGFEALPLMPGMYNVTGSSVIFDTPTGRIIESAIAGAATADEIKTFYTRSLPQLGWEPFLETEYRREGEVLKLEIADDGDNVVVYFFLSPK
jgi:hypothetical protein